MAIDPVCGMDVDERKATHKSDYNGKTYYFCSPGCKRSFDTDPTKYTALPSDTGGHHGHAGHGMH
jgi:Cu+-exporting ATPase